MGVKSNVKKIKKTKKNNFVIQVDTSERIDLSQLLEVVGGHPRVEFISRGSSGFKDGRGIIVA